MNDYLGPVYPDYSVSQDLGNAGQSMDFTNGGYDYGMPDTSYYMPSMYSAEPDYYSNMFPTSSAAMPNYSDYTSLFPTMSSYEMPMDSFPQGTDASFPQGTGAEEMPSFLDRSLKKFDEMPLDRQIGLGMSVVGGLGQAMTMKQRNKLAKKAMEQNEKLNAYQNAMMERKLANAAIADRYNNSYDVTAPATVAYRPLTAEQARSYGETGAPFQQVEVTPGQTTRVQLAEGGMAQYANGGMPKYMCGGEVDSKGKPKYEDGGYEGCDIPNYAMGGKVCMPNYAMGGEVMPMHGMGGQAHVMPMYGMGGQVMPMYASGGQVGCDMPMYGMGGEVYGMPNYASGGQADNIQAMLSEGEFVIPADVVSALGDGNTKAGASALHQMMKGVRTRARGGKLDKIPPPAKPAAKYMKKGK